jgi:hypothetical protein
MTQEQSAQARPAAATSGTVGAAVEGIWSWVVRRRAALRASTAGAGAPRVPIPDDDPGNPDLWGLALSGGGIRSGTFAVGLVSGLAERGIFSRFDLLSTVSGGGYAGSAIGKLFNDREPAAPLDVQSRLARMGGTWFVWWLRATSRYLTPRGAKDLFLAIALYVRNLFAIHMELALAGLAFGAVLALYNLLTWRLMLGRFQEQPWLIDHVNAVLVPWASSLWIPIVVPLGLAVSLAAAYWTIPSRPQAVRKWVEAVLAIAMALVGALGIALVLVWPWDNGHDSVLKATCGVVSVVLVLAAFGPFFAWVAKPRDIADVSDRHAEQRNRLTRYLAWCLAVVVVLFVLGLVDRAGWFVAFEMAHYKYLLPVVIAAGLAVFRTLADQMQGRDQAVAISGRVGFQVAAWAGVVLFALLVVFWVSLVYRGTLANLFGPPPLGELDFRTAAIEAAVFLLLPLAYMLLTGPNADFPNLASLHMFYRARLMRSYLGATNPARFPPGRNAAGQPVAADPLDTPSADTLAVAGERKTVFEVDPGDNVRLAAYQPFERGGPVHIVNATVNQTMDPLGGLFNQDRKGEYLSITSGGRYRVGTQAWLEPTPSLAGADLPTWMAISGAAFSPGLGGQTSTGLALLLFMAGVRLGYWWDMGPGPSRRAPPWICSKYALLWGEARAQFGGTGSRYWYLTDGGHFENTAAYSLLRERAQLVVLCDGAADPDYEFQDLENLVRKARIDLRAEIRFVDFPALQDERFANFGSIEQLRDASSNACIALARIDYDDREQPGWLVYVKPNMFAGLPVDLVNYRCENPAFPQEPTTDQFFSESQWESYFKLGREIGAQLDPDLLAKIAANAVAALLDAPLAAVTCAPQEKDDSGKPVNPRMAFSVRTKNLAKSGLSAGAVIAVLTAGAQFWSQAAKDGAARQQQYTQLAAQAQQASPHDLPARLVEIATRYCSEGVSQVRRQASMLKLFKAASDGCERPEADIRGSCEYLAAPDVEKCLTGRTQESRGEPVYWAVDYTDAALARDRVPHALRSGPPLMTGASLAEAFSSVWERVTGVPHTAIAWLEPRAAGGSDQASVASPPAPATSPAVAVAPAATGAAAPAAGLPAAAGGAGAPSAVAPPLPAPLADCKGKLVYIQIFDEASRPGAEAWQKRLVAAQASVPAIENVSATALRRGKPAPAPVSAPTAIYHTPTEHDCAAEMMKDVDPRVVPRPLGGGLVPTPGVIELWLAPKAPPRPAKS